MNRRHFVGVSTLSLFGLTVSSKGSLLTDNSKVKQNRKNRYDNSDLPKFRTRILTSGPNHHFFGYYGISPWSRDESNMVCIESTFQDRMPEPGEKAKIGLVNPENGKFTPIAETFTWNLQQGAMLHWNPLKPNHEIIYNDKVEGEITSISLDVYSGSKSILPRPVSGVAKKGKYAISLTYGRLSRLRKVVGYADVVDPFANEAHPEKDGVFLIDLESNEVKLIVSIAEVFEKSVEQFPELADRHIWFNHTDINPSGNRFLFLARSRNEKGKIDSAMFTADMDGRSLKMVIPFGTSVSHFGWRNDQEIVATCKPPGEKEYRHFLFTDGKEDFSVIGEDFIIDDGHCTFSPDGKWLATDRTQDESHSTSLWFFDMKLNKGMVLVNLPVPEYKYLHGNTRCDFHPRWNPSGNKICFDAIDTASYTRQLHLVEFLDV